jgi:homoserine O-acetyltransferase/O-succinyltransferase
MTMFRQIAFATAVDGETLPQLRLYYATLGQPHRNAQGAIDNAVLLLHWTSASGEALLTPEYRTALFAPGAPSTPPGIS